jgi:FMN phosphatase YigB (HAD superfamily)
MPSILFDLDDSLLKTNMGIFLPAYFDALGRHMAPHVNAAALIHQLRLAVRAMQNNHSPRKTLKSVFDDHFYQPLGVSEADWQETLTDFYAQEFPKLRLLVQPLPAARNLIDWCQQKDFVMAIATNPLFPDTATRQRIKWAGLNPDDFIFYSTYEDFHFTKPHLSYYAEVLGRCGWQQTPLAMIGDNLSHDLLPVEEMGIQTFWTHPSGNDPARPQGSIKEALDFLKSLPLQGEKRPPVTSAAHQAIIQATPSVLDSWLRRLSGQKAKQLTNENQAALLSVLQALDEEERKKNLPVFQSVLKRHQHDILKIKTQEKKDSEGDPNSLQTAFESFSTARLQSLQLIDRIQQRGLFTADINDSHPPTKTIAQFIERMAAEDKNKLKTCFRLLNIYKID